MAKTIPLHPIQKPKGGEMRKDKQIERFPKPACIAMIFCMIMLFILGWLMLGLPKTSPSILNYVPHITMAFSVFGTVVFVREIFKKDPLK